MCTSLNSSRVEKTHCPSQNWPLQCDKEVRVMCTPGINGKNNSFLMFVVRFFALG